MTIALKEYKACKHNETGVWHFCCVHGDVIYPVGRCRDNNRKDSPNDPCDHKTEKEAYDCYEAWEKEQVETAAVVDFDDILFPSNQALFTKLEAETKKQNEQP